MAAVRYNTYPVEAVLPDGTVHRGARVVVTYQSEVLVWINYTGVAKLVWAADVPGLAESRNLPERGAVWYAQRFETDTDRGRLIVNPTKARGCNCGNDPLNDITADQIDEAVAYLAGLRISTQA